MITLDYQLSPGWKRSWESANLGEASETDLLYRVLLGNVILRVDSQDFSAPWDWVPIVHFVASLRRIVDELAQDDKTEAALEFTESDARLHFERCRDSVLVSANFVSGEARLLLKDFAEAVDDFSRRVSQELYRQHPSLRENESFKRLLEGSQT